MAAVSLVGLGSFATPARAADAIIYANYSSTLTGTVFTFWCNAAVDDPTAAVDLHTCEARLRDGTNALWATSAPSVQAGPVATTVPHVSVSNPPPPLELCAVALVTYADSTQETIKYCGTYH